MANSRRGAARVSAAAFSCLLLLGGCAQLTPDRDHWRESSEQVSRVDKHSSFPAIARSSFERVNILELVDPAGVAQGKYGADASKGDQYDLAFAAFRESSASPDAKKQHRDSVQDRILSVSTSRCNVFKTYLRRQQADVNFLLGSATTVAGVLGAVLPGVNASRNLAGVAGMFSGVQAEYNTSYYSNLAAHVIVQGIELHQARLQTKIVEERRKYSVQEYSMEAAVKDAIEFDGSCSTVVGLLEAADSIKDVNNPGLPRAAEIIASVRAMTEISQASDFKALATSGELQKLLKLTAPASSPLIVAAVKPDADKGIQQQIAHAGQAEARVKVLVSTQGDVVARLFMQAQGKLDQDKRSAAKPAAAKESYESAMTSQLQPYKLADCVGVLKKPADDYGLAHAAFLLSKEGTPERITAEDNQAKQAAGATAATKRIELVVEEIGRKLESAVQSGSNSFSDSKLDVSKLVWKLEAPSAAVTGLCGKGS